VEPITEEEKKLLAAFTRDIPERVAHAVGCAQCAHTGYFGREGLYEIIKFDAEVSRMVQQNKPIADIRNFLKHRGDYLISDHAIDKVRGLVFAVKDVYEKVLVEETAEVSSSAPAGQKPDASVLVVEDDKDSGTLISHLLAKRGYDVTVARDGIEALLQLGQRSFSLVLSDVEMPNLDGFKLLEMLHQKGIKTPVLFLTGRTSSEDEMKGLELGATDYIRKPIQKDILWMRVERAMEARK
jgi:CheY-like chemotaxis protein